MRKNEIRVAAKAGIKNLCILLNERRFRTKRWETIWKDANHLITRQDVDNDL